jgi:probable O-glycosylation ligase (exosortase A-associated)
VEAWRVNVRIALDRPLTGGGFYVSELPNVFAAYKTPGREQAPTAPHSIYLQVLGDHGFPGLVLFLLMMGSAFFNLRSVVRHARPRDDLRWAADLASMMQVSLIGYLGAGALLSLAYYDVPLTLVALSAGMRQLVQEQTQGVRRSLPGWRRAREAIA